MSLINEALKKAQKQRAQEEAAVAPPLPGGGPTPPAQIVKRRQPLSARTIVWSVFGSVSLIIFSIAFTILFLMDSEESAPPASVRVNPAPVVATPAPEASAPPAPATPTVTAVAPEPEVAISSEPEATPPPTPSAHPASPPTIVFAPVESAPPPVSITPSPSPDATSAPTIKPAAPPESAAPARPDPRLYALIDDLRITGIRASATDPKVLMNDRLFRLNDIVDRPSGLRIVKIAADGLTFVDNAGAVYTKNF